MSILLPDDFNVTIFQREVLNLRKIKRISNKICRKAVKQAETCHGKSLHIFLIPCSIFSWENEFKILRGYSLQMKLIRHSTSNLVLKDPPGCIWLFGFFFVSISGMFIAGLSGLFNNLNEISTLEQAGAWIISLAGFSAGIWVIYSHPGITIDFDKRDEA